MTLVFGICLAVGGVTAIYSLLMGGDHDSDVHDGEVPAPDADHGAEAGDAPGFWILFLSMRFWVFFLLFFGLTGILLQIADLPDLPAALVSAAVGLAFGTGAAHVFRMLRDKEVSSEIRPQEMVGAEARVLLPVSREQAGKVRLQLGGQTIDRIAMLEGEAPVERGERVLVIAVREDRLVVSRNPALGPGESKDGR